MTLLMQANDIAYERFNIRSMEETALVVGQAFSGSDPMAIARGLSTRDFYQYIVRLGEWLSEAGLSVIARDRKSGRVVGALISGDFASTSPLDIEQVSSKFIPIFCLLQSLEDRYKKGKQIDLHEYLHLYMLAVAPQHRGKSIARTLVSVALEHGVGQGYKVALTEAANPTSQHIFSKAGFMPRFELPYGQFTYQDDRVFAAITNSGGVALMDKHLNWERGQCCNLFDR